MRDVALLAYARYIEDCLERGISLEMLNQCKNWEEMQTVIGL
jgi:hypothetical protein